MDLIHPTPSEEGTEAGQVEIISKDNKLGSLAGPCPEEIDPALWDTWVNWESRPANDFLHMFGQGLQGHNIGLGNGLEWVNRYIYGTHRARYYLIGADSGVGKTTISDFMFVLKAYEEAKRLGVRLKVFYCSFEISKPDKIARWVSFYIFVMFGLRLTPDYILGRIEGRLPAKEHVKLILQAYAAVEEILKCVFIMDVMVHPTKIFEDIVSGHYEHIGQVVRAQISAEDAKKGKKGFITGFHPHAEHSRDMTILMIDHLALSSHEMGLDTKGTMDKLSKYCVVLRNLFGTTICAIQQFSTDMLATNRAMFAKKSEAAIAPSRLDFGDSKATYRDADVVLAYIKPSRDLETFMGYNLNKHTGLGDSMVAGYILKNRYGAANRVFPLFLDGASGYVYDLPHEAGNMIAMEPWYQMNREIEKLCQDYSPLRA